MAKNAKTAVQSKYPKAESPISHSNFLPHGVSLIIIKNEVAMEKLRLYN